MSKNVRNLFSWLRDSAVGPYPIRSKLDQFPEKVDALADMNTASSEDVPDDALAAQAMNGVAGEEGERAEVIAVAPEPKVQEQESTRAAGDPERRPSVVLLHGEAIRMVFVIQHSSIWPSWRSVWQAALNDPRFNVRVVLTPFLHPFSSTAIDYDDTLALLLREHVPFLHADFFEAASFRPHVVFVQNPYEETRPEDLRTDALQRQGVRVAYIPYGLEMGGGAWNFKAQFDSPLHRTAWKIFARSERSKTMFGKYCSAGNNHVVVTGHPKFDALKTSQAKLDQRLVDKIAGRKVVLWTPHFSVSEQPTWSSYKMFAGAIFSAFRARKDIFLLIRPHPLFVRAMHQHGVWDDQGERSFRNEIEQTGNMALDESADYAASFATADALMADVGSFLLEFLPTGKPILYLHCAGGLGMNDDGELVNVTHAALQASDIFEFVEMVASGQDPLKAKRAAVVQDFLFGLECDTTAGERICEYVHNAISRGDSWSTPNFNGINAVRSGDSSHEINVSFTEEFNGNLDAALAAAVKVLPEIGSALDVDCGEGRFTLQLAKHVRRVTGYDGSWVLLDRARLAAAESGTENASFSQQDVDILAALEKFDLTACVNVLSSIVNDAKFLHILDRLMMLAREPGHLLLVDTFVVAAHLYSSRLGDQPVKYRSIADCSVLLGRRGFELTHEFPIEEDPERGLAAKLLLFKFTDPLLRPDAARAHTQPSI